MNISRLCTCAVLLVLTLRGLSQAPPLEIITLEQAVDLAIKQNRELARTGTLVEAGKSSLLSAQSAFAMRISPEGSAVTGESSRNVDFGLRVSKKIPIGTDISVGSGVQQDRVTSDEEVNRGRIFLEVNQPIFRRFGTLVNREPILLAERRFTDVLRLLEQQIDTLMLRTADTYTQIIRLERQLASDHLFLERMEKLLQLTRSREKQGRSTRVDTLRVDLQRGQAATRLEQNEERLQLARLDLADLLGLPGSVQAHLSDPPVIESPLPDVREAVIVALENRLDYAQALDDYRDRLRGVRLAVHANQPDLAIISRVEQYGEGPKIGDVTGFDQTDWAVGIRAGQEYNRAKDSADITLARMNAESARQQIEVLELTITRQVQQSLLSVRSALSELRIAERNRALATSRADLARRMFQLGRGDNFSVTDAENELILAEVALYDAQARAVLTRFQLHRDLGTLHEVPDALKPRKLQEP